MTKFIRRYWALGLSLLGLGILLYYAHYSSAVWAAVVVLNQIGMLVQERHIEMLQEVNQLQEERYESHIKALAEIIQTYQEINTSLSTKLERRTP